MPKTEKDNTERAKGLGRRTRARRHLNFNREKWDQTDSDSLRFQTEGRLQKSLAYSQGGTGSNFLLILLVYKVKG